MRKYILLAIAFLPLSILAQEKTSENKTIDDDYNPGIKVNAKNNVIKFAPLSFISGNFPVMYEKKVSKFLSIQLGAGMTHRNYVRGIFETVNEPKINYPYQIGRAHV